MILWDVARASAFVAFACYTLVVAWGIALSSRVWRPPAPQMAYHRFLASLGLVAVAIHVGALMLDRYARVKLASLVGLDPRPGVVLCAAGNSSFLSNGLTPCRSSLRSYRRFRSPTAGRGR